MIWNLTKTRALEVAALLAREGIVAEVTEDLEAAMQAADIITKRTRSHRPLIMGANLRAGAHLDLIGPQTREADDEATRRALIFVDRHESAFDGVGDVLQPIASGAIRETHVLGDLCDLASGLSSDPVRRPISPSSRMRAADIWT